MNSTLLVTSSILTMGTMASTFDDMALLPPMGWNSWNLFGKDITEQDVMQMADAMVSSGMAEEGYKYIVLDDCWQSRRDRFREMVAERERFPHGIRFLADYIHAKGLKFGIYGSPGVTDVQHQGPLGFGGWELFDAITYSHWDLDYLKYDWYYFPQSEETSLYNMMQQALYAVARPVIFNFHGYDTLPEKDEENLYSQWQNGNPVDSYDSMIEVFDCQKKIVQRTGPGHWNDPGMLGVGNDRMTTEEYRTHFSLWCMLGAPLMTGNDLRSMTAETLNILTNHEMIAIDQDSLGLHAFCFRNEDDCEIWIKPLENDEKAVCLFNRSNQTKTVEVIAPVLLRASCFGNPDPYLPDDYTIRDIWRHEELEEGEIFEIKLPPHGVRVLRFERFEG
jgi:alpha-galactosidase